MSITSVFTIGPFVPCTLLCKILNMTVMSICLVKQNDGTWVEKHRHVLRFLTFYFFLGRFLHLWFQRQTSADVYNCRLLKLKVKKKTAELSWWELIHFIVLLPVRGEVNWAYRPNFVLQILLTSVFISDQSLDDVTMTYAGCLATVIVNRNADLFCYCSALLYRNYCRL